MDPEFYVPSTWRMAPDDRKQGSGADAAPELSLVLTKQLREYIALGERQYTQALEAGIAPEQARLLLPAYGMLTVWRWSASIQSICHMLNQRLMHDTQLEFQHYAKAVHELIQPQFPVCIEALVSGETT